MMRALVVTLAALATAAPGAADDVPAADDVVAKVQKYYKNTNQYTAVFKQVYTNQLSGKDTASSGRLRAKKPGKLRWDYANKKKKTRQSIYAVGKRFWSVDHDNKQIVVGKTKNSLDAVALSFLVGKGDLSKHFSASIDTTSGYASKDDIVLEMKPKKVSARYNTLYLVVSPKDYRVKRSVVVEASGNTNSFEFFEPDTKTKIRDSKFKVPLAKYEKANYTVIKP